MIVVQLGAFDSIDDALDWAHAQGEVVRIVLMREPAGEKIRGSILIREKESDDES